MRRLGLVSLLAILLVASPAAAGVQRDAVTDLLRAIETALESGQPAQVAAIGEALPADDLARLMDVARGGITAVTIRERGRSSSGVLVEFFAAYGARAAVANWRLGLAAGSAAGSLDLVAVEELSSFSGLLHLSLDATTQFTVRDLRVAGPDFSLTLAEGTAFMAEVEDGTTAMVLRGPSAIRFTPADPTEQGELRIFNDSASLAVTAEDVFVRVNPREFDRRVTWRSRVPRPAEAGDLARARAVFDARSGLSYTFDLGDLSPLSWSVEPPPDGLLVDFRSRRHGWLTYARTPDDPEDISVFDRAGLRQVSLYASETQRAREAADPGSLDRGTFDVRHTLLDLSFDPDRLWLSGLASLDIRIVRASSSLTLRLAESLQVSSISSPQIGQLLPLRVAGQDSIVVGLPATLEPGRTLTLDVQYHGRLRPQSLSHEVLQVGGEPPQFEVETVIPVQARYLYSHRARWYPQVENNPHATASIRLTVPASYHVVASGRLVSSIESESIAAADGTRRVLRTMEYRADEPVRYLACLVTRLEPASEATAVVRADDSRGGTGTDAAAVDVSVLAAATYSGRVRPPAARVASMVAFYADLAGGAPYPALIVASLQDVAPGGHSPAYFAVLNQPHPRSTLSWTRDPVFFDRAPDFFLAHEVAHQWWGQAVGWRNYHEQWISEGFAQYFAWLFSEHESPDLAHRIMVRMRETAADMVDQGPVHLGFRLGHLRNDARIYRSTVYNKSAVVLHMLRRLMGDEAFFQGLRRTYDTWKFRRADVDGIEAAFQAETEMPLGRFFDFWIRRAVTPRLRLSWSRAGDAAVVIDAEQAGEPADVPYDVTIEYADGRRTHVTLKITQTAQRFTLPVDAPVAQVHFDDELSIVTLDR